MTFDQLETFITVVECGSFSRAADKLFLTQTALGHRISNIEKELGVVLLLRNRGISQVKLTAEGDRFIEIAKEIIKLWGQAMNLQEKKTRKAINISCANSMYNFFIPLILRRLIDNGFRPNAISSGTKQALYGIKLGDIDVAINSNDIDINDTSYIVDEIAEEQLVMMSHIGTAYGERISVKELDFEECFVIRWNSAFVNWCKKMFPDSGEHTAFFENVSLVEKAMHDDRWAVVPMSIADNYINNGYPFKKSIIEEELPSRKICLISKVPVTSARPLILKTMRDILKDFDGVTILDN